MNKKNYALIGYKLEHSISPFIHNRLFEISKIYADYSLLSISSEQLKSNINFLNELDGYNVTAPHKVSIIPYLSNINSDAKSYGSVNTVKNAQISTGFNTDVYGFFEALKLEKINVENDIVILGYGGVARAIAARCAQLSIGVTFVVRKESLFKAMELKRKMNLKNVKVCTANDIKLQKGKIGMLVNATPVGTFPQKDTLPIGLDIIKKCSIIFDLIYNPLETKLIKQARALGIKAVNGLSMLVFQALLAQKIWNNVVFDESDIKNLMADCTKKIKDMGQI